MKSIYLDIHGFKLKVSSDCRKFLSVLESNLYYFICEKTGDSDISVDFKYERSLINKDNGKQGPPMALVCSTGSKVYVGQGVLNISDFNIPRLNIIINVLDGHYSISATYGLTKRELFFTGGPAEEKLLKIARYIIYFPLFRFMREKRQLAFLHASALEYKGKGYVFVGLPGAGKTRCIMKLLEKEGVNFLSDNYLLCADDREIFAFPELIRIWKKKNEYDRRDAEIFDKVELGSHSGKSIFKIPDDKIAKKAELSKVFFLKRSDSGKLTKLEAPELISDLVAVEKFTKDFYEYSYTGLLALSGIKLESLLSDRCLELSSLFKGVDCYELCVKENSTDLSVLKEII